MASDAQIAKLLSHIHACTSAVLPGKRLPFYAGAAHIGYLLPDLAAQLAARAPAVSVQEDRVVLAPSALGQLNDLARAVGLPARAEDFDVRETPGSAVLGVLDRGALPAFGVLGVGVHLNGLVRRADGVHLWVGKRAATKKLDPGKLDHLVAGGVPAGYAPFAALIKEGAEEAGLPEALVRQAVPRGVFRYDMERAEGLRRDAVYAYDLELNEDFVPQPVDGEVESFALWPLAQVAEVLSTTDMFKFNVALVLIDLLLREGFFPRAADILSTALDRLRVELRSESRAQPLSESGPL